MKRFVPVRYADLNARRKEAYNFHKVAARLADFGYNSVLLSDDYGGADFLAVHADGTVLKVQLKSRFTLDRKYMDKDISIAFRTGRDVVVYDHDDAIERVHRAGKMTHTASWTDAGSYTVNPFPRWARDLFADCIL